MLHDRIDPTVELLRKKQPALKCKRVQPRDETNTPPIGAPSWCLNKEALERFNRSNDNIPRYDYDTEGYNDSDNDTDDNDDDDANTNRGKRKTDANTNRRKRKTNPQKKLKKKEKKHKKSKKK